MIVQPLSLPSPTWFRNSWRAWLLAVVALGLAISATSVAAPAPWSHTIALRDLMRRYVFPEELLSYRIEFPGTFSEASLRLREEGVPREFQLGDPTRDAAGNLLKATVLFRAGLDRGQTRTFVLDHVAGRREAFPDRVTVVDPDPSLHTATLRANRLQVRVPYGSFAPRAPLRAVPAPILQIGRNPEAWIGRGSFVGDDIVERVEARPIEDGNLRLIYRVEYHLAGGRRYTVDLTVWHDESHVTLDERLEGFPPDSPAFFKFSFKDGLDPNGRLVATNGGYNADGTGRWRYTGAFDGQLERDGALPLQLGIWSPHSGTCVGAATFWSDRPGATSALLFSRYRTHEWKSDQRYIWDAGDAPENIRWYQKDGDKYALARLAGRQRHWAMAVIAVSESRPIAIESQDGSRRFFWKARIDLQGLTTKKQSQPGAGPEVRLYQKLTEFSLDWVKDLVLDWDEVSDPPLPPRERAAATVLTYDEYCRQNGIAGKNNWFFVEHYWGRHLGGATELGRAQPGWLYDYAVSRQTWTPAQRREVRAILAHWISSVMQRDGDQAHIAMISGHPNFIIDTLFAGVYCAIFPNHPDAPRWKSAFLRMLDEWLLVYQRDADPANRALAGRWVENIACYSQAALRGLRHDVEGFLAYDGTDILKGRPRVADWLRWHMYALVTPMQLPAGYPYVFTPPQGSHAREALFALGRANETNKVGKTAWEFHGLLYDYARLLEGSWPELAAELKFCLTKGREGRNPGLESALFRDFGAILRHDFSGPHEVYVNVQQIGAQDYTLPGYRNRGTMNYRWSGSGNGAVYYAARGRIWSWNDYEANGDGFDVEGLPAFAVEGRGLGYHPTDGVLYNLGEVQFYRANGSHATYRSRDVLMVRDDCLALRDDVVGEATGKFHWSNPIGEMPAIHRVRSGSGDNLHIVEPRTKAAYEVTPTAYGARLRQAGQTEYVGLGGSDGVYVDGEFAFRGRTAYAGPRLLALFEGQAVELNGFRLEVSGGDFGVSAALEGSTIQGRVAGRSGGSIRLTPPPGFTVAGREVQIDGRVVPHRVEAGTLVFEVAVNAGESYRLFRVSDPGAPPVAPPRHPPLHTR